MLVYNFAGDLNIVLVIYFYSDWTLYRDNDGKYDQAGIFRTGAPSFRCKFDTFNPDTTTTGGIYNKMFLCPFTGCNQHEHIYQPSYLTALLMIYTEKVLARSLITHSF